MGQPLTGNEVQATYEGLLKTSSNATLATSSLEPVSDGAGNDSALLLAQEQAALKGTYVEISNTTQGSGILVDEAQGDKVLYYGTQDFQFATVTGLPDTNTTYTISAQQDGANVDVNLNGSDASVDTVTLVAGTNITLSQTGDSITIDAAGGGGGGGLVAGTGQYSMKNADSLVQTPATATSKKDIVIGDGAYDNTNSSLYGENVIIGTNAGITGGEYAIVIGRNAKTVKSASIALGSGAEAQGNAQIVIGANAVANGADEQIVIGLDAFGGGNAGGIVIGRNASNGGINAIAIGRLAQSNGSQSISLGHLAKANPEESLAIGYLAEASGQKDIIIGNAQGNGTGIRKIAIGTNITNYAEESIMIGSDLENSDSSRVQAILIGNNIKAAQRAIVIGNDSPYYASANVVQLGNDHTATQSNESVNIGYANSIIGGSGDNIIIGQNNTIDIITGVKPGAAIIGNGITAKRANTLHINQLNIGTVSEYADNTAAVAAGLLSGQVYRTGELLKIVL